MGKITMDQQGWLPSNGLPPEAGCTCEAAHEADVHQAAWLFLVTVFIAVLVPAGIYISPVVFLVFGGWLIYVMTDDRVSPTCTAFAHRRG